MRENARTEFSTMYFGTGVLESPCPVKVKRGQAHSSFDAARRGRVRAREHETGKGPKNSGFSPSGAKQGQPVGEEERVLFCATCAFLIAQERQRIAVQGSTEHRFMNPAGFTFHLGCFAEAIGAVVIGPDSHEYPWFAGHAWRYAHCAECGTHLGWHFRAGHQPGFFGLILDRLRAG
jgi:hypothetical protein